MVSYNVENVANRARKNEWPLGKRVASSEEVDSDGDAIGKVQQHNGRGDNGIESTVPG